MALLLIQNELFTRHTNGLSYVTYAVCPYSLLSIPKDIAVLRMPDLLFTKYT